MGPRIHIGQVVFDSSTGEVFREGAVVRLEPQPASVLTLLAAHPGELVSHDELRHAIWGNTTHVNFQQNLHYCVRQIRRALGDKADSAPLIETIPRRGYRLRSPAAVLQESQEGVAAGSGQGRGARWPVWVGLAAAALVTMAVVERRPNDHHRVTVALLQTVHDLVY